MRLDNILTRKCSLVKIQVFSSCSFFNRSTSFSLGISRTICMFVRLLRELHLNNPCSHLQHSSQCYARFLMTSKNEWQLILKSGYSIGSLTVYDDDDSDGDDDVRVDG